MYILDTSAIRGIAKVKLETAAARANIAVPTFSVLELASHLHDSLEVAHYLRARGNFLKCAIPRMLEDPFVLVSQRTGTSVNPSRRDDKIILGQLIEAVEQSSTPSELDQKTLTFPDAVTVPCKDIGTQIAGGLKKEEAGFVSHVRLLATIIRLDPALNGQHSLSTKDLVQSLIGATQHLNPDFDGDVQSSAFLANAIYAGYLIHRLYRYANARPVNEELLTIDPNDCEDAYIAACLDVRAGDTLVTDDTGTIEAIRNTITALNTVLLVPIESSRVMSNAEFLAAMEIAPSGQIPTMS
jgi:hypothetical protein